MATDAAYRNGEKTNELSQREYYLDINHKECKRDYPQGLQVICAPVLGTSRATKERAGPPSGG